MDSVSVNKFRDNLKSFVEQIVKDHFPLKVARHSGESIVLVSTNDWESTAYIGERQMEGLHENDK